MREPLTVHCRSGVPVRFRRPDRRRGQALLRAAQWYRVRAVVASWSESPPWWRVTPGADRLVSAATDASQRTAPIDRRVWRVEARTEPQGPLGVFDLVELPDGGWALARAHD
jgi:hypothetical protein